MPPFGSKLREWSQHEPALVHRRMRQGQLRRLQHSILVEDQVEIDRAGALRSNPGPDTPHHKFNSKQSTQEIKRRNLRLKQQNRIQETRLIEISDWLGVDKRRHAQDVAQSPDPADGRFKG